MAEFLLILLIVTTAVTTIIVSGFDIICTEKSVGVSCIHDLECYGPNTICANGRCSCQLGFEPYDIARTVRICRPAPSDIGAECQRECKPPLLCRKYKCECWQGNSSNGTCTVECPEGQEVIGQECQPTSHLNDTCTTDNDCVDPFTTCVDGVCVCHKGTMELNNTCVGFCPDGKPSNQTCARLYPNERDVLRHSMKTDSCPDGFYCMTYGKPRIGHCCKASCPYGLPDTNRSCEYGVPYRKKCPRLTHYCFTLQSPGWKGSVCCPRPCRNPAPLFINGECLAEAHYGDRCRFSEQCEGGLTMVCKGHTCVCKAGYSFSGSGKFPTCEKICSNGPEVVGKCLQNVSKGKGCLADKQCPLFSKCYYGRCVCNCGYTTGAGLLSNKCINPDDPFNLTPIIDRVERFFSGSL